MSAQPQIIVVPAPALRTPPPAYSDIAKPANDLLNKDFFHLSTAAVEVKTVTPNGVAFTAKGKTLKDESIAANIEAKFSDKASGFTLTQGWNNANVLDTKLELAELLAPGLKGELITSVIPNGARNAKLNLFFKQSNVHGRAFFDLIKPKALADISVGQEGFTVGGELGYDIASAKVDRYSLGVAYSKFDYTVSAIAFNNLSVFSAAYYHKVSPLVEAGAKATWDSVKQGTPNVEFAAKYKLDKSAFVKAKFADSGVAAVSYSQALRPGVTLGLGSSFNALKLAEPVHKLGASLTFTA
ncbi:hypothetical protein BABINDRAFT_167148 [Babjeviella inositovora NRRL Y-12698]|uniref:Mitochondrial outer membrane protein porin n=1 Tax=Babjeviella inositovora NRRL Y-12698 TaxID=984486 RepID=A0A1E3QQU2_9ASCO|nr:uncharacterized protein BABINDRAFT_167148 [Babjeviella inositovora NRRL Y-12698]ODQ80055.1 hypothetical protein BABINDRAFT_167148 [Babjeviella inositovora NRRL Y-12698]